MDPTLVLAEQRIGVLPGTDTVTVLTVRNASEQDEQYRLEVLGEPGRWARVQPRVLVAPAGGPPQTVELAFRPPDSVALPPGGTPFGIRCVSLSHPDRSSVVEGDLVAGAVPGLEVRIDPVSDHGRRVGRYLVVLENHATTPAVVHVAAKDPRGALGFAVAPVPCTVAAGASERVHLAVRPRRRPLVGSAVTHRFTVEYRDAGPAAVLPATFEQRPVLTGGVLVAAVLSVVGVLACIVVWAAMGTSDGSASAAVADSATAEPVVGHFVIYGPPVAIDDPASSGTAEALVARLQSAGVDARIVDSRRSEQLDDGSSGLLVVLADRFPTLQAARGECAARRALAPQCFPVAPQG